MLRRLKPKDVPALRRNPVDAETLQAASRLIDRVRTGGFEAVKALGEQFGDWTPDKPLVYDRPALHQALHSVSAAQRHLLERTAQRIEAFATAQRACLTDLSLSIPGGEAGHLVAPVETAGCYAPGGRFPLPSSVLMTAVTARTAGVSTVWVASPKPTIETLAAAAVSNADALLAVGGVQAIAALAFGAGPVPTCDTIVGPGNRWVTAAKQLVSGQVQIDMLAGPSELVILADSSADPQTVAADLLAQAEHDPEALPILITTDPSLADAVDEALTHQIAELSTHSTASLSLENGYTVCVTSLEEGIELCNRLAPEHLEVLVRDAQAHRDAFRHYGGLFLGHHAAEVLGDYGAGPNHTLPTGGTARSYAGLSVINFLRVRTWMHIHSLELAQDLVDDAVALARIEGLEGHARSALRRKQ